MLSEAKVAAYRRMTPEERWREVEELMSLAWRTLLDLPAEERARRMAVMRKEHETDNAVLVKYLGGLRD